MRVRSRRGKREWRGEVGGRRGRRRMKKRRERTIELWIW